MKTKFTCDANPTETEQNIAKWIANELPKQWMTGRSVKFIEPIDCREGPENCGSGPLTITGLVEVATQMETHTYTLDSAGSQWRNYGHPSGTKYDIEITLRWQPTQDQINRGH